MPTSRAFDKLINGKRQAELTGLPTLSVTSEAAAIKALNARFGSFAATVQNRIDTDAGGPLTLTGSLDAQVQRALSQALRRGSSYQSQTALTPGSSQPATTLAPSAYSAGPGAYTADGYLAPTSGYSASAALTASGMPAVAPVMTGLPPDQSVLVREAMITQQDLLSSLDALQSLSVQADPGDIQAYKSIIRAEVMTLTTEFARPDLPRPARVRVLLGGLLGWSFPEDKSSPIFGLVGPPTTVGRQTGDVEALLFLLNLGRPVVASGPVDQQVALQAVVRADAVRLLQLWIAFQFVNDIPGNNNRRVPSMWPGIDHRLAGVGGFTAVQTAVVTPGSLPSVTGTFSDRLIRANLLLPVIAEDAARVAGALDAIGFGPGPQETTLIDGLQSEVDTDLDTPHFPAEPVLRAQATGSFDRAHNTVTGGEGPTIKDVLDWAADLAGGASLDLIGQAGQLGLNLIADQADELFFILIAILKPQAPVSLPDALGDSQVNLELRSLARDLSELADQGI